MRIRLRSVGYRDQSGAWPIRELTATIVDPGLMVVRGEAHATRVLFELILRLRRPHEGRIALDGVNARKLRVADVRAHIGWLDRQRTIVQACLDAGDPAQLARAWDQTAPIAPGASLDAARDAFTGLGKRPAGARGLVGLRLALACVLMGERPIVMLDDPTLGLAPADADRVAAWLADLARDRLVVIACADPRLLDLAQDIIDITPGRVGDDAPAEPGIA